MEESVKFSSHEIYSHSEIRRDIITHTPGKEEQPGRHAGGQGGQGGQAGEQGGAQGNGQGGGQGNGQGGGQAGEQGGAQGNGQGGQDVQAGEQGGQAGGQGGQGGQAGGQGGQGGRQNRLGDGRPNFSLNCIPKKGKCRYQCNKVWIPIFAVTSVVSLITSMIIVGQYETKFKHEFPMPVAAFQVKNLNHVIPQINLFSKEICLTDSNPMQNITVSLAQKKCFTNGNLDTTLTISSLPLTGDHEYRGLLFNWPENTQFEVHLSMSSNSRVTVSLLKSPKRAAGMFKKCLEPEETELVDTWPLQEASCRNSTCVVSSTVNETHYYYLCFKNQIQSDVYNFTINTFINTTHMPIDNNTEKVCSTQENKPCCLSYSNIFSELHHKSSRCMYLITNVTGTLSEDYLTDDTVPKISVTTKVGPRVWVFCVLVFFMVVSLIGTTVLSIQCWLSYREKEENVHNHTCLCSCYQLLHPVRLEYDPID